jgi:hypothetical protein
MTLTPTQFLRSGGGELTLKHFQPDEDAEEVLQGYITEATGKVAAVEPALQDGIASKWVYYRAFKGAYAAALVEPQAANTGDAGSVSFYNPDGLLKLALDYKDQFDEALALALSKPALRPFGPTKNTYIF